MSYFDRLRTCAYISPRGSAFNLQFEELVREAGKKAPVTEFPGQDQGAVQDLGQATTRYPLVCYISGENYDQEADRFWKALNEPGPGELKHPRYGNRTVTPVAIQQRESFVEGAGRAIFEIEFVETLVSRLEFPQPVRVSSPSIIRQSQLAQQTAIASLEAIPEVDDPGALARLRDGVLNASRATAEAFNVAAEFSEDVRSEINRVLGIIEREIDDLVQSPVNLVVVLAQLYNIPLQLVSTAKAKLDGYRSTFQTLGNLFVDRSLQYAELFGLIEGANANVVMAAVAGAVADAEIATREEAVEDAETLAEYQAIVDGIDADYETKLTARQATTAALLRILNENLPIEQRETLQQGEALIPLVDRLFRDIDDLDETIQFFIDYNRLQDTEILIVPSGRTVRWYE